MYRLSWIVLMISLLSAFASDKADYISLCYHDIPSTVTGDKYAVDLSSFIKQIEYLRTHGYNFISLKDIELARNGKKKLPGNAVLLTFDDGYKTFHSNVLPILELYKIPAVLAVVTSWLDKKPWQPPGDKYIIPEVMNPAELKEIAVSPLVEVVCHTHNQHRAIQMNPEGNTAPAVVTRKFESGRYENLSEYNRRLYNDFSKNISSVEKICGYKPRAMVWPYGKYNGHSLDIAKSLNLTWSFTLDSVPNRVGSFSVNRHLLENNPDIRTFIADLKQLYKIPDRFSFYRASLRDLYSKDPLIRKKNVDEFVEKVFSLKPSALVLKDLSVDGKDLFYRTDGLHEKDFFSHVARALTMREVPVYPQIDKSLERSVLKNLLTFSDVNGVFFGFLPTQEEISIVRYYLPCKKIIAPAKLKGIDIFTSSLDGEILTNGLYRADTEDAVKSLRAAGARHIISDLPLFNLSIRDFPWTQH